MAFFGQDRPQLAMLVARWANSVALQIRNPPLVGGEDLGRLQAEGLKVASCRGWLFGAWQTERNKAVSLTFVQPGAKLLKKAKT
jgi:hypothetical protein